MRKWAQTKSSPTPACLTASVLTLILSPEQKKKNKSFSLPKSENPRSLFLPSCPFCLPSHSPGIETSPIHFDSWAWLTINLSDCKGQPALLAAGCAAAAAAATTSSAARCISRCRSSAWICNKSLKTRLFALAGELPFDLFIDWFIYFIPPHPIEIMLTRTLPFFFFLSVM